MKNCAKTDETVNEFFEKLTNKNAKLLAAVTLYRYISELDIIEEALYTNKPVSTDGKNKVHRVIMDNTVNAYRKMKTQGYDEKKRICSANMTAFESKCLCDGIKLPEISENSIAKMFADFFEDDKFGIRKICFSIILCLNDSSEVSHRHRTFDVGRRYFRLGVFR